MPYLEFFGLAEHPFTLTPNPAFYFPTHAHANALASLQFALGRDTGILKVVGEIGTGKTLLCRLLLQELAGKDTVAYLNAPQHGATNVVHSVCGEFGLKLERKTNPYTALTNFLVEQHAAGRRCVLVIDEAQALGHAGLETVRLLSNIETANAKLLQIVLFGQAELDEVLEDRSLPQLRQRIVFSFTTQRMNETETLRYIQHRLQRSLKAWNGGLFSEAAARLIARQSRGVARVVNILADKALLAAYAAGAHQVLTAHAEEAIRDSAAQVGRVPYLRSTAGRRALRWWLAASAVPVMVAALMLLPPPSLRDEAVERLTASWRVLTGSPVAGADR